MIINHNINALNICNNINKNNEINSKVMNRISSGLRINSAADDSAGLGISQGMKAQIRGLEKAQRNIQDGISLIQTAEGGLAQIENPNLQRMRELAVQAANGTLTSEDRSIIQKEIDEIKNDINDISNNTEFNKIKVLRTPISEMPGSNTGSGKADIVFVVDNTGSMSNIQNTVAKNITAFINSITSKGVTDIRMGVVEYKDYTINKFDFSGDKWTNNPYDISNALNKLADTNSGGTENAMKAITEVSNYYDFRSNDFGSQTKHIIFITDEDADDEDKLNDTLSLIQSNGIQISGIYNTTDSDVSEFNTLTSSTGGVAVNLKDSDWGEKLSSVLGTHIGSTAGTTEEDDKMPILNLQVGPNSGNVFSVELFDARTSNLEIDDVVIDPFEEIEKAIDKIDKAIEKISSQRAKFGAYQNALEHIASNVENSSYNITYAESRISDADIAKELMEVAKSRILHESAQSLLNQANKMPESILNLMKQWGQR